MKFKFTIVVLIFSVLFVSCTLEDEEDERELDFISQIEGTWDLYSIRFQFFGDEIITSCDQTTQSEFTFDRSSKSGTYVGTTYFFFETLPECLPETFSGNWEWDYTGSSGEDEESLEFSSFGFDMTINSTPSNINYSNSFTASFDSEDNNGITEHHLTLIFKNEDENERRVYKFVRIN